MRTGISRKSVCGKLLAGLLSLALLVSLSPSAWVKAATFGDLMLWDVYISATEGGTVSPAGHCTVNNGASPQILFTPDPGYELDCIYVNGTRQGPNAGKVGDAKRHILYTVYMNNVVRAVFKKTGSAAPAGAEDDPATCSITAGGSGNQGGHLVPQGTTAVPKNGSITYTAVGNQGKVLDYLMVDGQRVNIPDGEFTYTLSNVTSDHTITPYFKDGPDRYAYQNRTWPDYPYYGQAGSNSPAPYSSSTYVPNSSNGLDNFVDAAGGYAKWYTISITSSGDGIVSPSGQKRMIVGQLLSCQIQGLNGNVVTAIYVDGQPAPSNVALNLERTAYSFNDIHSDHTLHVVFGPKGSTGAGSQTYPSSPSAPTVPSSYTIHASAGAGGVITPTGATTVSRNTSRTYYFYPSTGYSISGVYVDGTRLSGTRTSYTFSNVSSNHTIKVEFSKNAATTPTPTPAPTPTPDANTGTQVTPPSSNTPLSGVADTPVDPGQPMVTISASSNLGGLSESGPVPVNKGGNKTFYFTPPDGYKIGYVEVDGHIVSRSITEYTFKDVSTDHTLYVYFGKGTSVNRSKEPAYTLKATCSEGSVVFPVTEVTVHKGEDFQFWADTYSGYALKDVYIDGKRSNTISNAYSFKDVSADHEVRFECIKINGWTGNVEAPVTMTWQNCNHSWMTGRVYYGDCITAPGIGKQCVKCRRIEYTKELPRMDHSYLMTREDGQYVYTCSVCGHVETSSAAPGDIAVAGDAPAVSNRKANVYLDKNGLPTVVNYSKGTKDFKVETYGTDGTIQSTRTVTGELGAVAGLYISDGVFYVAYRTSNFVSKGQEFLRIVKYDRDWNRLGAASAYSTTEAGIDPIFDYVGSWAEDGDALYYYVCIQGHSGHNYNFIAEVNTKSMTMESVGSMGSSGNLIAHSSHSMTENAIIDSEGRLVTASADDYACYGIMLAQSDRSGSYRGLKSATIVKAPGKTADWWVSMEGKSLTETRDNYLVGYIDADTGSKPDSKAPYNIRIAVTPKDNISASATKVVKVKDFQYNGELEGAGIYFLPTSLDGGYVVIQVTALGQVDSLYHDIYVGRYDNSGNVTDLKEVQTSVKIGYDPCIVDGKIMWAEQADAKNNRTDGTSNLCIYDPATGMAQSWIK